MHVVAAGKTDVGQKRDHNEDSILLDPTVGLYVVCDGMGGHAAGEVASQHAVRTVQRVIGENKAVLEDFKKRGDIGDSREKLTGLLENAVNVACSEIYGMATADSGKAGMGTTLVLMLVVQGRGIMAHVGDSRLYMVRQGQIHQLTEDHSYTSEMIKRGKMTREQARQSPYSNVITRAVGIQKNVQVDTLLFDIIPGDTFLLCSDGLHGYAEDPNDLADMLSDADVDKVPGKLIEMANSRGGKDNISAIVLRAIPDPEDKVLEEQRASEVNLKLDTLKKIPLFRYLTYQELVKVLNITYLETYEAGTPIIKEAENGEELYIILAGRVVVSRGNQEIVELHPGVHFGEMALVDQSPRSATVTAKDATRLLVVQRRSFYTLIRKEPVLAVKLLWSFVQVLSRRLRETNEQLSGVRSALESRDIPFMDIEDVDENADTQPRGSSASGSAPSSPPEAPAPASAQAAAVSAASAPAAGPAPVSEVVTAPQPVPLGVRQQGGSGSKE
ncbi:MAG: Stp1/IreP family PP2C-type Ser/Thr phosphatase [Deltaproteobacteria bacterium]|nr:Stp1/IreP family PP2C-type Ser/Thr phosphatase [Deltaproteobacteria bacterium]